MKTVAFTTLGCRVNQYDTDAMKGLFLQNNYEAVDFDEIADIYVINTCSVTNMGEKKSRQLIRKAKRQNEDAYVIVTGCYAQLDPDAIAAIDGVVIAGVPLFPTIIISTIPNRLLINNSKKTGNVIFIVSSL